MQPSVQMEEKPAVWHLVFLWLTYAGELSLPFWSYRLASQIDWLAAYAGAASTLLLSIAYYFVLAFPSLWAILTILTGGSLGGKFNGWLIHHWVSNWTFLMILYGFYASTMLTYGIVSWAYVLWLAVFQIVFWVLTMMFSYKAIKFGNPEWQKTAPGWIWPSLFFIDNGLDEWLAEQDEMEAEGNSEEVEEEVEEFDPFAF